MLMQLAMTWMQVALAYLRFWTFALRAMTTSRRSQRSRPTMKVRSGPISDEAFELGLIDEVQCMLYPASLYNKILQMTEKVQSPADCVVKKKLEGQVSVYLTDCATRSQIAPPKLCCFQVPSRTLPIGSFSWPSCPMALVPHAFSAPTNTSLRVSMDRQAVPATCMR